MRNIISHLIALSGIYIIAAVAIVLPLPADVAGITRSASGTNPPVASYQADDSHPPSLRRKGSSVAKVDRSPQELVPRCMTSTGGTVPPASGGTSAYQAPQPTHPSSAPEAQNVTLVHLHPCVEVPTSSAYMGSIATQGGAVQLEVISATPPSAPSPSTTPSPSHNAFGYYVFLLLFLPILILCAWIIILKDDTDAEGPATSSTTTTGLQEAGRV